MAIAGGLNIPLPLLIFLYIYICYGVYAVYPWSATCQGRHLDGAQLDPLL